MSVEIVTARSFFTRSNMVALVLAIILLFIFLLSSPKAQALFSAYAILLIIFILIGQLRVNRAVDLKQLGERAVQTLWLSTSLGLVAVTMPPAPYFELSQPVMAASIIIGAMLVISGAYGLLTIRKLTGVYLSV
jgi:FtsH-binding integral membrane protein